MVAPTESGRRDSATADMLREILIGLREQNKMLLLKTDETDRILERIAVATEKTAIRMFRLVLPIYISLIGGVLGAVLMIVLAKESK